MCPAGGSLTLGHDEKTNDYSYGYLQLDEVLMLFSIVV